MAHKAMIGGKAYEVSGGKAMVGGTVYDISGGKTMVGGKVYEIGFSGPTTAVTITTNGAVHSTYVYVTINGSKYSEAANLTVEQGTEISAYVGGLGTKEIKFNNATVATSGTYTFNTAGYSTVSIIMSGNNVAANKSIIITAR